MYEGGYYVAEEEWNKIASFGLYTFDVEVIANPYDSDVLRSQALRIDSMSVEDLGVNEETGEHFYLVRYSLIGGRDASQGILYLYNGSTLTSLQSWDISELLCTNHEAQDGLVASHEGRNHALLVRVPESILEVGQYYFVLYFIDNTKDYTKNHANKAILQFGRLVNITYRIYWTGDTVFSEVLMKNAYFQPDEVIEIEVKHPCPPRPNTLPLVPDINGDGINDWDYPGDKKIPGTNYVVGVFGIKKGIWLPQIGTFINQGSYYFVAIGIDLNNNGLLEREEIQHRIAECPFSSGINHGWIQREADGRWYVHWTIYNDFRRRDAYLNVPGYQPQRDDGYGNKKCEYEGVPKGYPHWQP